MAAEKVTLVFEDAAIDRLADLAEAVNKSVENIGARRLQTVLERLLDEISFEAPTRRRDVHRDGGLCRRKGRYTCGRCRLVEVYSVRGRREAYADLLIHALRKLQKQTGNTLQA